MAVIPTVLNVKNGSPARLTDVEVDSLIVNGVSVVTAVLLASGQVIDLNGEADSLILDAAQNVRLDGSSTGKLRIKISGAYDFEALANIFRALSGSVIETNTINETTAASGVTIDGVLLKDGGAVFADAAAIEIDTINEATAAAGVTLDGVLLKDSQVTTDVILEKTGAAGVTADGVLLKDGASYGIRASQILTATGAITVGTHGVVQLNHATVVIAATLAAPAAGADIVIVNNSASGTAAHTVTLPGGVTFNGTNAIATFDAPGEALHLVALSATRWYIVQNNGSVAFS